MKTKSTRVIVFTALFVFGVLINCTLGASIGQDKKENRKVGDFSAISLSIPADLFLTQGSKNEVIIEADEDLLAKIETEIRGSSLEIKFEKWYNYKGLGEINVYVTVKDIDKLVVSGSGDIVSKSPIKSDKISFIVSGSGSVMIDDLFTKKVDAMVTGSGDVKIKGNVEVDELDATVTGSGDFESVDLKFREANLSITGSGSIHTYVIDELDASITGSGKIYYKGKPVIDANITGSGKIRSNN